MKQLLMTFQNQIQKVLTYIHGLPDDTWKEPDPEDPLSLVDQVSFAICFGKTFYSLGIWNRWSWPSPTSARKRSA